MRREDRLQIGKLRLLALVLTLAPFALPQKPQKPRPPADPNHPTAIESKAAELGRFTRDSLKDLPASAGASAAASNYIDEAIFARIRKDGIPLAPLCSDAEYLRRVSLDLGGRLPDPAAIRKFVDDPDPAKREKVIDTMLVTSTKTVTAKPSTPFLDRWTYFFADLLRVNNLLGGGRALFHQHIYNFLTANQPYDAFVRELLTASTRSNHYSAPVNYLVRFYIDLPDQITISHEDTYDEWAIHSTRMFLGVNVECISCHDGKGHLEKINTWLAGKKRSDVWRQAAFFSKVKMVRAYGDLWDEFVVDNGGKGRYDTSSASVIRPRRFAQDTTPAFLLTGEHPQPNEDPREAYARMLTGDPQFARATVNLIWAELFGLGIVDPPLDFDLARYAAGGYLHSELLDRLAADFRDHRYNVRYLLKLLLSSSAYQLSHRLSHAADESRWKPEYVNYFSRRLVRRMPAEQFWDALSEATGVYEAIPVGPRDSKVKFVMQTASPDDLPGPLHRVLSGFGLDDRKLGVKNLNPSMVQASILLNNELVKKKTSVETPGRLRNLLQSEPPRTNQQVVEELFLATLTRLPSPAEAAFGEKLLSEQHTRGAEDLLWALINKPEFVLNY